MTPVPEPRVERDGSISWPSAWTLLALSATGGDADAGAALGQLVLGAQHLPANPGAARRAA
jgi:hypothetical protein